MKYRPVLPEKNDNVSKQHPLIELAKLLIGLMVLLVSCYLILGLFIDFSVNRISPETEQRWFRNTALNDVVSSVVSGDAKTEKIDSQLFESLTQCADIDVELSLWESQSEMLNALAVPGGDIIVFSGLREKLQTENAYAFVLAHELAHFKHRDHLRGMGRAAVLGVIASVISGSDTAIVNFLSPLSSLSQAQFSQSRESAADALALELLNCHYGHVGGATEFFNLVEGEETDQLQGSHYFASHPQVKDRLNTLEKHIKQAGYSVGEPKTLSK